MTSAAPTAPENERLSEWGLFSSLLLPFFKFKQIFTPITSQSKAIAETRSICSDIPALQVCVCGVLDRKTLSLLLGLETVTEILWGRLHL